MNSHWTLRRILAVDAVLMTLLSLCLGMVVGALDLDAEEPPLTIAQEPISIVVIQVTATFTPTSTNTPTQVFTLTPTSTRTPTPTRTRLAEPTKPPYVFSPPIILPSDIATPSLSAHHP